MYITVKIPHFLLTGTAGIVVTREHILFLPHRGKPLDQSFNLHEIWQGGGDLFTHCCFFH